MRQPWHNWFHCSGSTYGAWLRGDRRGWRTRDHREHVEGDYKNPPKKPLPHLHEQSKRLMKRHRVTLTPQQRRFLCLTIAEKAKALGFELDELCVGGRHFHALVRFLPIEYDMPTLDHYDYAKVQMGKLKGYSARMLSKAGLAPEGGIWSKRCKCKPIADKAHKLRVVGYLREHAQKGAAVLSQIT
jgi:REP element-mobilizing transposase RayT